LNFLVKKICDLLVKWCEKKGRKHLITGGSNEDVYLVRYIVFKSKWGCVYIHRFMRSDADDPHDHPWSFWTYVISNGYTEVRYDRSKPAISLDMERTTLEPGLHNIHLFFSEYWTRSENVRKPGDFSKIRANDIHQVVVDKPRNMDEIKDAPYTICLMGPRVREWGFWPLEMRGTGFLDWREYLDIKPGDSRIEGSE